MSHKFCWRALSAAMALLLCAGCPKPKPAAPGTNTPSSAELTQTAPDTKVLEETTDKLPAAWPADELPAYPGARITAGRHSQNDAGELLIARMETGDDAEKVNEFYSQAALGAGYSLLSSSQVEKEWAAVYEKERHSLAISLTRAETVTKIELQLVGDIGISTEPEHDPATGQDFGVEGRTGSSGAAPDASGSSGGPEHRLVPRYPGSRLRGSPTSAADGYSMTMETEDSQARVQDWYGSFYKGKGFAEEAVFNLGTQSSRTYTGSEGRISVTASATQLEGGEAAGATLIVVSFTAGRAFEAQGGG